MTRLLGIVLKRDDEKCFNSDYLVKSVELRMRNSSLQGRSPRDRRKLDAYLKVLAAVTVDPGIDAEARAVACELLQAAMSDPEIRVRTIFWDGNWNSSESSNDSMIRQASGNPTQRENASTLWIISPYSTNSRSRETPWTQLNLLGLANSRHFCATLAEIRSLPSWISISSREMTFLVNLRNFAGDRIPADVLNISLNSPLMFIYWVFREEDRYDLIDLTQLLSRPEIDVVVSRIGMLLRCLRLSRRECLRSNAELARKYPNIFADDVLPRRMQPFGSTPVANSPGSSQRFFPSAPVASPRCGGLWLHKYKVQANHPRSAVVPGREDLRSTGEIFPSSEISGCVY